MTDRNSVLVHVHVLQGDAATKAGAGSVKAMISSPHGAHGTHAAVTAGSPSGLPSTRSERCWAVAFRGQKYDVVDAGANGITIARDGAVVWTGHRLPSGAYHTRSSSLAPPKVEGLLKLVAVGDDRTPKVHMTASRPSSTASAARHAAASAAPTESKRPISEAQAEALARGREHRSDQLASQRAGTAPASTAAPKAKRARKPRPSAPRPPASATKPVPKARPAPASKAGAAKSAAHPPKAISAKSGPHPSRTPAAAAPTKRKPGRPRKHAAAATAAPTPSKRTERAPATRRSVRNPAVDDTAVLAEIKRKLKRDDPKNFAALYDVLRRIWFAGGREATLAWMAARNITTVVEAFRDWVDKNPEAARVLLGPEANDSPTAAA